MLHPYRVLKHTIKSGNIETAYFHTLREAHKACLPNPNTSCCHLLFNGLQEKLENNEDLIRVTCYVDTIYWIESLIGKSEPFLLPHVPYLKIECGCHCNKSIPE